MRERLMMFLELIRSTIPLLFSGKVTTFAAFTAQYIRRALRVLLFLSPCVLVV